MRKKKIVGKFNKSLTKIEFYEIVGGYGRYTLLRKQGTTEQYLWDNKRSWLSEELGFDEVPSLWEYPEIIDNINKWNAGHIFFWATSKFVTEYGLPTYDSLMEIYEQLCSIRLNEINIYQTMQEIRGEANPIQYFKCWLLTKKFLRRQRRTIKDLEREFKVIW